jgi:hypothetical protein
MLGTVDIPEVAVTSATAPGVTNRWTNLTAFTDEVLLATTTQSSVYNCPHKQVATGQPC